jgi:uncharacterized membrane protein YhaH (DUF805 family)
MLRGILVWFLIMAAETAHGILRNAFLAPRVGLDRANLIGWPIGMVIVLVIAFIFARWIGLQNNGALIRLGAVWALLTFLFEITIGVYRGYDAQRLFAEINPFAGGLILDTVVVMFLAPLVAARLKGI